MTPVDAQVADLIRSAAADEGAAGYLQRILTELVAVNTAPEADLAATAAREKAFFDRVEQEIRELTDGRARFERPPIDAAIQTDPTYSLPGYAADRRGHVPPIEQVYAGRSNFLAFVPGSDGKATPSAIVHAHADVVSPWFGPRLDNSRVYGRGAADNKAQIAVVLGGLRLMREVAQRTGKRPSRGFAIQLTLDEEIGGNGSVSMARDPRFASLPVLMLDASDLVPYCAHRGAVYYRCRISASSHPRTSALEVLPFVVLELETEGRRIQRETNIPLFDERHVQTNHGVLGPFGHHPGSVCDHVAFNIDISSQSNEHAVERQLVESLNEGLEEYLGLYGDKSRQRDPATGQPKVAQHYALHMQRAAGVWVCRLDVWGKGGHMAAVRECDNAITKAAYLLRGVLEISKNYPDARVGVRFANSHKHADVRTVVLEGGQGFTPSHPMRDIESRLVRAARRGAREYCQLRQVPFEEGMVEMSFDRLHNDAYADSPDCVPMQAFRAAFDALGERWPEPIAWETSCDARIYHHHGHPVAIFGGRQARSLSQRPGVRRHSRRAEGAGHRHPGDVGDHRVSPRCGAVSHFCGYIRKSGLGKRCPVTRGRHCRWGQLRGHGLTS